MNDNPVSMILEPEIDLVCSVSLSPEGSLKGGSLAFDRCSLRVGEVQLKQCVQSSQLGSDVVLGFEDHGGMGWQMAAVGSRGRDGNTFWVRPGCLE
jgi:hypothetical protein